MQKLSESMKARINQQTFLNNKKKATASLFNYRAITLNVIVRLCIKVLETLITQGAEVMVLVYNTDILILLIYYWQREMENVYFLSESSKTRNCWRIRDIAAKAGAGLLSHILFVHACSGCDTTSATFGQW